MDLVIILIGIVIGAVIGWNYNHLTKKGKFTRLDINDDGSVWLEFDYKKRFGNIGDNYKSELTGLLKEDFKGLTEVNVTRNRSNEMMICMKIEKKKDEPFILWLEEQEKCLTNLCGNY